MKPREIVLNQICHKETFPIPFTLGFEGDVADRMDEHYGTRAWRERMPPYIVSVSVVDFNRRIPIAEGLHRDDFGSTWMTAGRPYHLVKAPLERASFEGYEFPAFEAFTSAEMADRALEACERNQDSFLCADGGLAMFEQAWSLRGFENALVDIATDPGFVGELLDRLTELMLKTVEASVKLPVEGVLFMDDWCDQRGVMMGKRKWQEIFKPRVASVFEAVHKGGKLTMLHSCGNLEEIVGDLIEVGLDVLESVQPEAMNPYGLKRKWGERITFWGGLGSQSVIPFGNRESIHAEVKHLCEEMARGGGYVLAPAKALQPETPTENAVAVLEAFFRYTGHEA